MSDTSSQMSSGSLVIPCPPDKFAEFMAGLLGKPQIIRGTKFGIFSIDIGDVENFYHLMHQRVSEQNNGALVQFSALTKYSDGTSVEVSSIEALKGYAEIRPLVSTGITMSFIYIIKFLNKEIPERQKIDIDIDTNNRSYNFSMLDVDIDPASYFEIRSRITGMISYRIEHTARTWGVDIENMLKDHISSLISPRKRSIRGIISKKNFIFLNVCSAFTMMMFLAIGVKLTKIFSDYNSKQYSGIYLATDDAYEKILKKIDYLSHYIGSGFSVFVTGISIAYVMMSVISSYAWSVKVINWVNTPKPSFVLLTRQSEIDRDTQIERYNQNWLNFVAAFLLSISAGIIGNWFSLKFFKS